MKPRRRKTCIYFNPSETLESSPSPPHHPAESDSQPMTSRPHTSPPPPVRTVLSPIGPTVESWERAHEPLAWSSNFINKSGRSCSRRERSWERESRYQSADLGGYFTGLSGCLVLSVSLLRHCPPSHTTGCLQGIWTEHLRPLWLPFLPVWAPGRRSPAAWWRTERYVYSPEDLNTL